MPWLILLASAVMEAVWATALGLSHGFTKLIPTIVFLIAVSLSMYGLAKAAEHIPIGTAYAIWTGIGATLTVLIAVWLGTEQLTWLKALFMVGIVSAVAGLKLVSTKTTEESVSS